MVVEEGEGKFLDEMDEAELTDFIEDSRIRVMDIDVQLSARKFDQTSTDAAVREAYRLWHGKAVWAKSYIIKDMSYAKALMNEMREERRQRAIAERTERNEAIVPDIESADSIRVLRHVVKILHEFIDASDAGLSPAQKVILKRAHRLLAESGRH